MARPREFDENAVLAEVVACFWARGYEATSVRDLVERTGLTGASLYNAFGDKRALYQRALDYYVDRSVNERIRRCGKLPPREAIRTFFTDLIARSLDDPAHKGCMLINTALDVAPHDQELRQIVAQMLEEVETFFRRCVAAGQRDGTISKEQSPKVLARHLLCTLAGLRVLARIHPERRLLEGAIQPTLTLLDGFPPVPKSRRLQNTNRLKRTDSRANPKIKNRIT